MLVTREKIIEVKGKKEKVVVSFDIPISIFRTKEEIMEEFGKDELGDCTIEKILDEEFGMICNLLSMCLVATLHSGCHFGDSISILQGSILNSGLMLGKSMRDWKELEKMI